MPAAEQQPLFPKALRRGRRLLLWTTPSAHKVYWDIGDKNLIINKSFHETSVEPLKFDHEFFPMREESPKKPKYLDTETSTEEVTHITRR
jgi:hypothetical protein